MNRLFFIAGNNAKKQKGDMITFFLLTLVAAFLRVDAISAITGIRYNHVYNVVKNEVLVHGLEVETSDRSNENSKKNQILVMLEQGKTVTEISKELKCMYNYVWQVAKAGGYTGKKQEKEVKEEVVAKAPKKSHKVKTA